GLLLAAILLLAAFIYCEQQAVEALLPLSLFQEKVFLVTTVGNFLLGCILFGRLSFMPLFMQIVLGTNATAAGKTIMFLLFSWICGSILSARLILRHGYRPLVISGIIALVIGNGLLSFFADVNTNKYYIYARVAIIGIGMGFSTFSLLMAVQNSVSRIYLGI